MKIYQHKLTIAVVLYLFTAGLSSADNLLRNGSFEEGDPIPSRWRSNTWSGAAEITISTDKYQGNRSVCIQSQKGADAGIQYTVDLKTNTVYKLSGWIKTKNVNTSTGLGAFLNVHELDGVKTNQLRGTQDWTHVETFFYVHHARQVNINCMLGGWGDASGSACFDEINLEPVTEDKKTIQLDIQKTGPQISKYVYGQLIEHLGYCVHGGMWAEMLEDRKFYYPIKDEYAPWIEKEKNNLSEDAVYTGLAGSPWKVIGPAGSVVMKREKPFVGLHTPYVLLKGDGSLCGIEQLGLGLVKDKSYTGRIYLCGESTAAPVNVSLIWGNSENQRQTITINELKGSYFQVLLNFISRENTDEGRLEIVSKGQGSFSVGCVSLMPADNIDGWRKDTLDLLKELKAPIYKWPGGNFVSGYDWREGIGERDFRAPKKNLAWGGIEDNDVGLNEYLNLCRRLNAEAALAVNTGSGDANSAAKLVEYVNGPSDTLMGKIRVKYGQEEPFNIQYFYVGNEMWGNHQIGYIPLDQYYKKHNQVVAAMKEVDPSIQVIAVGRTGTFSQVMLRESIDYMDLISDNFYRGNADDLYTHVTAIPAALRVITDANRRYKTELPLSNTNVPLAIDEWGYWYGKAKYGQIGVQYCYKDALGLVAGLHEMFRNSDIVQLVHYAQAVNTLGAIKTTKTEAFFDIPGYVFKLYRNHFGEIPLAINSNSLPLDVCAALSEDRKNLVISIVNPTDFSQKTKFEVLNSRINGPIECFTFNKNDSIIYCEPGEAALSIKETSIASLPSEIPTMAVILLKCKLQ